LTAFLGGNATEPLIAAPIKRLNRFIKNEYKERQNDKQI